MNESGITAAMFAAEAVAAADPERRVLLDAARAEFIEHGFRRTSPAEIARRAKVSRATVYRRLGDKDAIVTSVVVRDVVEFFANIQEQILPLRSAADRMTEAFVMGVRATRTHPLVRALRRVEPDTFVGLLAAVNRPPATAARDVVANALADETLPVEQALPVADLAIRITATMLIAPSDVAPLDTDEQAREFARKYLVPMVVAASGS